MLSDKLREINDALKGVSENDSLLVKFDDTFHLVRCEYGYVLTTEPISDDKTSYSWKDKVKQVTPDSGTHGMVNIEGHAMINFVPTDFGYLPMSNNRSLELTFDENFCEGVEVITNPYEITDILSGVVGENYVKSVVSPFIEGNPTSYKLPERGLFRRNGWKKLEPVLEEAEYGEKIYVGFNNSSWMITRCSPEDASAFTSQYNDPLFVENQEAGRDFCGITSRKGFVLPVAGWGEGGYHHLGHRMQNKPKIVTKDKDKAVEHMKTQPFGDFAGVVEQYMD